MNHLAESYVKLLLAIGQHDSDYVDAYHGPGEWQNNARRNKMSLGHIREEIVPLIDRLQQMHNSTWTDIDRRRRTYLVRQLQAAAFRTEMLQGKKFPFDVESQALYDAVAPVYSEDFFRNIVQELGSLLPGKGTIPQRFDAFRKNFVIPQEKLDTVFGVAIAECRRRTKNHIPLPEDESFNVEYVRNKSWSGYNWYKGNNHSVIQMNTDFAIFIDRAVDLAAHEGYPGHHVYNTLIESELLVKRKWIEFCIYPLFSPQSLIAEGSANYGIEVVFSRAERLAFERDALFPLAGLDPSQTETYYATHALMNKCGYAGNEAARGYLNGTMNKEAAVQWLEDYALMPHDRAEQRIRFFEQYRSYVINYNLGQDLVKQYIEKRTTRSTDPERRWKEFASLLASPMLPGGLQ